MLGKQPPREAAMTDLVLLRLAQLRVGALVVGPGGVGDEGRVVAEATLTSRSIDQAALAAGFEAVLCSVLLNQGKGADVVRAPLVSRGRHPAPPPGPALLAR